jgi:hypothetical protein
MDPISWLRFFGGPLSRDGSFFPGSMKGRSDLELPHSTLTFSLHFLVTKKKRQLTTVSNNGRVILQYEKTRNMKKKKKQGVTRGPVTQPNLWDGIEGVCRIEYTVRSYTIALHPHPHPHLHLPPTPTTYTYTIMRRETPLATPLF